MRVAFDFFLMQFLIHVSSARYEPLDVVLEVDGIDFSAIL